MRVDYRVQFPEGVAALVKLEEALRQSPLEPARAGGAYAHSTLALHAMGEVTPEPT